MMEESATYRAIIEKGVRKGRDLERIATDKRTLLRLGRRRFGEPDAATVAVIESIGDVQAVEQLLDRVIDVASWAELIEPRDGESTA